MNISRGFAPALRPLLPLGPGAPGLAPHLALGRAHEATGPAAAIFAALTAGRLSGPVLWIRPGWRRDSLHPEGLLPFFDPSRLVLAAPARGADILWAAEEALRSGAAPLVVAEPEAPPGLTPLRRLQLAAEAGGNPLCLLLPPEAGSSGAVESRWRCAPLPARGGPPRWRFERAPGKAGPPLVWETGLGEIASGAIGQPRAPAPVTGSPERGSRGGSPDAR
ncbi:MAG: ImuA family protein [Pikeienuella sp.]|uniref:ImuA family protein n=1 Tax=Pikeienuella sp. TaxID=2831957 RepID=UPI003918FF0E